MMTRKMTRAGLSVITVGALSVAIGCATLTPAETMRDRGDREFRLANYNEAADAYQGIVDRYPGDWRAQYMLGRSHLESGNLADAREALEIAHTRRPDEEGVVNALAETMYRQGHKDALIEFLRRQAIRHESVEGYLRLAHYCGELNDPDSAQDAITQAIVLDNGRSVEPYLAAADLAERLGDDRELVRRLRQAYGIAPTETTIGDRLRALGEIPGPTIALPPGA